MSDSKRLATPPPVASDPSSGSDPTAADIYVADGPAETGGDSTSEAERAKRLAERYRLEYVDMEQFYVDQELFRSIPAELMLRYGFVPHRREDNVLVVVVSDPTDVPRLDELALLLGTQLQITVGPAKAY